MDKQCILPGETSGDYSLSWKKTFDFVFLTGWLAAFAVLLIATYFLNPELYTDYKFFLFCFFKLLIMLLMSLSGGLLCRKYCKTDGKGYIITNKDSWFKVNYTRKLQHFAAYLVPLISAGSPGNKIHPMGIIPHLWESLLVLFIFLLLIKPIRENSRFFMLQFNSLDRPEDRPNTLKWIVVGNILPGLIISTVFKQYFFEQINAQGLVFIIIFIIGIGDGLAEPVGIYWGKRKYLAPAWFMKKRYIRSYAGSLCVLLCGLIFTAMFFPDFPSVNSFVIAMLVIPILMTFVEATAPHSMDTPMMMIIGFTALYLIVM